MPGSPGASPTVPVNPRSAAVTGVVVSRRKTSQAMAPAATTTPSEPRIHQRLIGGSLPGRKGVGVRTRVADPVGGPRTQITIGDRSGPAAAVGGLHAGVAASRGRGGA